jgi:acylphosphatase
VLAAGVVECGQNVAVERRRVVAHGLVQGVFFRDTLRQAALRHGVAGWVRNRGDGSVEAVFEGAPDDVERLVEAARRGPRGAQVERLEVWEEPVEGISGFSIVG